MIKTIRDLDIKNKRVIIRCDFNVPIKDGVVVDDTRIVSSLETIKYALSQNSKVILLSHLGRVKEESDKNKNSLKPVYEVLTKYLDNVFFIDNFDKKFDLENGCVYLLENTRWFDFPDKKESNCDLELSRYFASFGDVFINDAFGTIHRKHASNYGISSILESGIGFLVEKELAALSKLNNPVSPYVVILGGSKVSDKIGLVENLITKADYILIGGGMAFTFLKALGYNIGKSIVEEDYIEFCKDILSRYKDKIVLPVDVNCSLEYRDSIPVNFDVNNINSDYMGLDIGNKTIELFKDKLKDVKMIMWNGPLGVYEFTNYCNGTKEILKYITNLECYSVLGGGDIVACANSFGINDVSHISTGGGATLSYLEGGELPGLVNIGDDV